MLSNKKQEQQGGRASLYKKRVGSCSFLQPVDTFWLLCTCGERRICTKPYSDARRVDEFPALLAPDVTETFQTARLFHPLQSKGRRTFRKSRAI